jgi:hypothetical protein
MQFKQVQAVPLTLPSMKQGVRPRYFSLASAGLLMLLVYANTSIAFKEMGLQSQLMAVLPLVAVWFGVVGMRLESAIFASIALMPAITGWGVGYLALPGMALSLSDLLTVITFYLFIARPQPLYRTKYTTLIWWLLGVSFTSILLAANPTAHFGKLIRLGLSIGLVTLVLASRGDTFKKAVFYGMLFWPMIALASLAGAEGLWRFISFGDGAALNLAETGEVLLGSHTVITGILFFLPLLVLLKSPRVFIFMVMAWLLLLVVFSHSRSLTIGISAAMLLYFLFMKTGKGKITKLALIAVLGVGLVFGVGKLDYFNFGADEGSKAGSSYLRIAKMWAAWNTFTENPVLGIGYGAAGAIDTQQTAIAISAADHQTFLNEIIDVKASAEFTPSQILAETGLAGGVISLFLIGISFKRALLLLKNPDKPVAIKMALLCLVVVFVTSFLGSNAFSFLTFMLAIPFIFDAIELRSIPNRRRINRAHVSVKNGIQGAS